MPVVICAPATKMWVRSHCFAASTMQLISVMCLRSKSVNPPAATAEDIKNALTALDSGKFGIVLRAKGIVAAADGSWIHFDYVPEEHDVRTGSASTIGKLCVIGSALNEQAVAELFGV